MRAMGRGESLSGSSDAGVLLLAMSNIEKQGFPAASAAFWASGQGWTRERYATALASLEERGMIALPGKEEK